MERLQLIACTLAIELTNSDYQKEIARAPEIDGWNYARDTRSLRVDTQSSVTLFATLPVDARFHSGLRGLLPPPLRIPLPQTSHTMLKRGARESVDSIS